MSVNYGGPPAGGAGYAPTGRVNFGWIGESFELFKANMGVWIVAGVLLFIVPSVVGGIIGGIYGATTALHPPAGQPPLGSSPFPGGTGGLGHSPYSNGLPIALNLVIQLFSLVYTAYLYGGIYRVAVKQVRGERTDIADIFSGGPLLLPMLGFMLLSGLASFIGTLLCIVPGFLVAGMMFPGYALIADGEGVMNAISRSVDAMKRDMWMAAGFVIVMVLLIYASFLAFCLGEFVTVPMFWLVSALAYRDMIGMPGVAAGGPQPGMQYGAQQYGAPPGAWPPPPSAPQAPPPGYAPPPPSWGQPPAQGQPPSFGQPPAPGQPPPNPYAPPANPPGQSLGGGPLDPPGSPPPL